MQAVTDCLFSVRTLLPTDISIYLPLLHSSGHFCHHVIASQFAGLTCPACRVQHSCGFGPTHKSFGIPRIESRKSHIAVGEKQVTLTPTVVLVRYDPAAVSTSPWGSSASVSIPIPLELAFRPSAGLAEDPASRVWSFRKPSNRRRN